MVDFKINIKGDFFSTKKAILKQIISKYNVRNRIRKSLDEVNYIIVINGIIYSAVTEEFYDIISSDIEEISMDYLFSKNKSSNLIDLI